MHLQTQIYLIIYSLVYGFITSILLDIHYKYIQEKKAIIKYSISFLFALDISCIYFLILQKINNGILHIYSLLFIIVGFIFSHFTLLYIDKHHKK